MSATNFVNPRTEAYGCLVQQIANLTDSDYSHCYDAVESIVGFYDNHSCEQLAITLLSFLKDGEDNRGIVIQLKEHLRQAEVVHD
jgi:hypothetical protein